ncbi:ketopantoate reductase PanG [Aquitalea magnusonii]|uniref:Ketopantoate reductase PanG n=1 Tax=Aquitalea magnusonii TaxID=332411 RepID=A0A3G9GM91_9NEIS|nr:Rossmann-like and DUF2520 domain-containing protein [Aquitalea magnusonii]BBF86467.1 ketopantoate reductase PanG [Aquitalea magnusonii]
MQRLNIIGTGKLGRTLGRLAASSGQYRVQDCLARSTASAQAAVDFIGAGRACQHVAALQPAALILLSVPDDAIAATAQALADGEVIAAGTVVFHASGAAEAEILAPLREVGAHVASLHPAFSFADPERAVQQFAGTLCALEGDAAALPLLQDFAAAIGARPFALAPGGKAAYHAALSVASNYLVTLTDIASQLARQGGVDEQLLPALLGPLMQGSLANALNMGSQPALTGPIVRGDAATVARHLAVLPQALQPVYRMLGERTVALAGERLPEVARQTLLALLRD